MPSLTGSPIETECRQCCSFCDRLVQPAGCIESGCDFLYVYDDEHSGRRYMGCLHKVYGAEIDVELFEESERTRLGFGGVKLTGAPRPQCRVSVERAYHGTGEPFDCVNPRFFDTSERVGAASFDLRDSL